MTRPSQRRKHGNEPSRYQAGDPQSHQKFSATEGVADISLQVYEHELLTLLGPSGCGKTTILRAIGGFNKIDSGKILLDGAEVQGLPPEKRPTGMVFQSYNLWPHMTIYENMAFGLKLRKTPKKEMDAQIAEMLALVKMSGSEKKYPTQLSGGQQQRVAIARALVLRPAVLLLDEPFSALDAKIRGQMREELKRIQREAGLTVIFVTHDQEEAMAISDRIAVMNQGAIEQLDSPTEIYDNPHSRFVAGFIGEMNFLDEGGAVLAVRPEDIALRSASGAGMARIESVMPLGHYTQIILVRADGARLKVFIPKEQALGYIPGQTADYSFTRFKQFGAAQASA